MAVTEYIGARYVPKFFVNPNDGSADWVNTVQFEPLTIVTYAGNSYTSKCFVPTGIAITDDTYWALTGNFNGQVATYVAQVQALANQVNGIDLAYQAADAQIVLDYQAADAQIVHDYQADDAQIVLDYQGADTTLYNNLHGEIQDVIDATGLATMLYGKYMVITGDSLVRGNNLNINQSFPAIIASTYNCTFDNLAQNGWAISNYQDNNQKNICDNILSQINNAITAAGGNDKIFAFIIQGGANDCSRDVPIGSHSATNLNQATFWGAMNYIYQTVASRVEKCRIMFMTNPLRYGGTNSIGLKEGDYARAMLDFCRYWSIPCFDMYSDSGINLYNPSGIYDWADAGVAAGGSANHHYSAAAYQFLAPRVASWIAAGGYNTTQGNYIDTVVNLSEPSGEPYTIENYRSVKFPGGYQLITYRISGITVNPANQAGSGMYYSDQFEFLFPADMQVGSIPNVQVTATGYNESYTQFFAVEAITAAGGTGFKGRFFSPQTGSRNAQLYVSIFCNL